MTTTTIELPQHPGESAVAYDCRVRYCLLGVGRTVAKVAEETGKGRRQLERWCTEHRWRESARQYDETAAQLALQADMRQYAADLRQLQTDQRKVGEALTTVGLDLLVRTAKAFDGMELTPQAITIAVNALRSGIEMRGWALSVQQLREVYEREELLPTKVERLAVDREEHGAWRPS